MTAVPTLVTTWPGAVTAYAAGLVAGPPRPARVLAAFPTCLYLGLGRHADVLAVLTRDAIDLPIGVRLAMTAAELDRGGGWGARAGDDVVVGLDRIALPTAVVSVVRRRPPSSGHQLPVDWPVPPGREASSARSRGHLRPVERPPSLGPEATWPRSTGQERPGQPVLPDVVGHSSAPWWPLDGGVGEPLRPLECTLVAFRRGGVGLVRGGVGLVRAALAGQEGSAGPGGQEVAGRVAGLVGLGAGLTPSGDDLLCGILLTLRALGRRDAHDRIAAAVRARLGATTSISAALLVAAIAGQAVPDVARLIATLAADPGSRARRLARPDDPLVRPVLAIGHTSGADLLAGVASVLAATAGDTDGPATDAPVAGPPSTHPHEPQGAARG